MVESTARRERGEPKSAPLATYLWEVPQKPVAVRLAFDLIDRMESEVIENFRSLTSRGSEIGGVLLGSVVPGSPLNVIVQDYETIPCDYSRGPLYRLSDADLGRFERAIEQHSAPGSIQVMGFFRAHSRKGLSLDAEDLAFLDARFRDAHHIALLVRPFATKTSVGGLFIREDGAFHGEASYLEFPFRSGQLTPSLWTPPEAAPAPPPPPSPVNVPVTPPPAAKPSIRPQVVPIGLRRDSGASAPSSEAKISVPPVVDRAERKPLETKPPVPPAKAPAAEARAAAPARPTAPEPKAPATEVKPAAAVTKEAPPAKAAEPAKPAADKSPFGTLSGTAPVESQGSRKIMLVLGGIAATVAALVLLFVYPGYMVHTHQTTAVESPAADLTLRVEPSGTDLLLTWNKNCAAIADATHGVLSINDGDRHENYDMDPTQLTTGSIVYTPVTGDVSFRMEVTGKNQSKTVTESVRSLRTRPSPMPDGKSAAASPTQAKANSPQAQPAGAAPAPAQEASSTTTTPAEVTPAAPAKTAPKAFNTASLADRLRPASASDIAVANLSGAAPASPAGVNMNSNLSMPFANAAAPVAPAPPATKKTTANSSGGKVAAAQLVYRKEPSYPTAARQMGAHGEVVLEATIGTDGRVRSVKVISGHPLLVQAAKEAVMQWRYRPTLLDGQPVENKTQISLNFLSSR
ncbi:MAG TPA: energy transducer TonB [Bryobacteraceae bacterium]|jgi:protein TonB